VSRLSGKDELRLKSYYEVVSCYGCKTLLSSSWGVMVDAINAGKIGSKTFATSDSAHAKQISLLDIAEELGKVERRLRAMSKRHRQTLTIAYCARQQPDLVSHFSLLAGPVLLTTAVVEWYKQELDAKRCSTDSIAWWLAQKLPRGKVITSPLSEKVEKIRREADFLLEQAVESWETAGQSIRSGGR